MKRALLLLTLILGGCSQHFVSQDEARHTQNTFLELRQELADVKHALKSTQVSLQIVEERLQAQENTLTVVKNAAQKNPKQEQLSSHLSLMEKKLEQLEKMHEKVLTDLRSLSAHTDQSLHKMQECEKEIAFQKSRLDEISKLKTTLSSISQAMQQNGKRHSVKSGESLEKIARKYNVSISNLKKQNNLSTDRIIIGQELEIPNE